MFSLFCSSLDLAECALEVCEFDLTKLLLLLTEAKLIVLPAFCMTILNCQELGANF